MTHLRNTFDADSLGTLEAVLDDIHRELASGTTISEADRAVITREHLAKLILRYAQDGESDPARLRSLVLKEIGRSS